MFKYVDAPRVAQLLSWQRYIHTQEDALRDLTYKLTEKIQHIDTTDLAQVEFHQGYRKAIQDLAELIAGADRVRMNCVQNERLLLRRFMPHAAIQMNLVEVVDPKTATVAESAGHP